MRGDTGVSAADIYVRELEDLAWGYPVYRPDKEIHIGDVGFFRRDHPDRPFKRLFNVLSDAEAPLNSEYGVPPGFLKYQDFPEGVTLDSYKIITSIHDPVDVTSNVVVAEESRMGGQTLEPAAVSVRPSGTSPKRMHTTLSLGSKITRSDIPDADSWRRYIAMNNSGWYSFARSHGFGEKRTPYESIVLIRGCDRVKSWEHIIPGDKRSIVRNSETFTPLARLNSLGYVSVESPYTVFVRFFTISQTPLEISNDGSGGDGSGGDGQLARHSFRKAFREVCSRMTSRLHRLHTRARDIDLVSEPIQGKPSSQMPARIPVNTRFHLSTRVTESILDRMIAYLARIYATETQAIIVTHGDLLAGYKTNTSPTDVQGFLHDCNIAPYISDNGWIGLSASQSRACSTFAETEASSSLSLSAHQLSASSNASSTVASVYPSLPQNDHHGTLLLTSYAHGIVDDLRRAVPSPPTTIGLASSPHASPSPPTIDLLSVKSTNATRSQEQQALTPATVAFPPIISSSADDVLQPNWVEYGDSITQALVAITRATQCLVNIPSLAHAGLCSVKKALNGGEICRNNNNIAELKSVAGQVNYITDSLSSLVALPPISYDKEDLESFQREIQAALNCLITLQHEERPHDSTIIETLAHVRSHLGTGMQYLKKIDVSASELRRSRMGPAMDEINKDAARIQAINEQRTLLQLHPVLESHWNASSSIIPCLATTRVDLIHEIIAWSATEGGPRFMWLTGQMGTGKSAIAKSVCEMLYQQGTLASAFFVYSHEQKDPTEMDPGHISRIIPTLAYFFACKDSAYRKLVVNALMSTPGLPFADPSRQIELLFNGLLLEDACTPRVIVIDGVNDLPQYHGVAGGNLIQLLQNRFPARTKFLLSGSRGNGINGVIKALHPEHCHMIHLEDVDREVVARDVLHVYTEHFGTPALRSRLITPETWPPAGETKDLVAYTGPLFAFAAIAKRYVSHPRYTPRKRLSELVLRIKDGNHHHLDALYRVILDEALVHPTDIGGVNDEKICRRVRLLLAGILLAREPVDTSTLAAMTGLLDSEIETDVMQLSPVLHFLSSPTKNIRVFHVSFYHFMVSQHRIGDHNLVITPSIDHAHIAMRCFDTAIKALSSLTAKERYVIPTQIRYAYKYAWSHLIMTALESSNDIVIGLLTKILEFCESHRFAWLDVLGDLNDVPFGISQLGSAVSFMEGNLKRGTSASSSTLLAEILIHLSTEDGQLHQHAIAASARPVFNVMASQRNSKLTTDMFQGHHVIFMHLMKLTSQHVGRPGGITLSAARHGTAWASANTNGDVQIWTGISPGSETPIVVSSISQKPHVIPKPASHKYGLALMADGQHVISATDESLRISTLEGTSQNLIQSDSPCTCMATAMDGDHIVYVAGNIVCLWSISTRRCIWALDPSSPPPGYVLSLTISVDDEYIATGSTDETVAVIGLLDGTVMRRFSDHDDSVTAVAFSPHHKAQLASASKDRTIRMWDVGQNRQLWTLYGHADDVTALAWTRSRNELLSGSKDRTVRLWDAETRQLLFSLSGFASSISSIAASSWKDQILIGCEDGSIHTWGAYDTAAVHDIKLVASSPRHSAFAASTENGTVHIIDGVTGRAIQTIVPVYAGEAEPAQLEFSNDGSQIILSFTDDTSMRASLDSHLLQSLTGLASSTHGPIQFSLTDDGWLNIQLTGSSLQEHNMPLCWFPHERRWRMGQRPLAVNGTKVAIGGVGAALTLLECSSLYAML